MSEDNNNYTTEEALWDAARWYANTNPEATLPGQGTPCCTLVAVLTRRALDLDGLPEYATGSEWWRAVNIWAGYAPLAPMPAYADMVEGGTHLVDIDPDTAAAHIRSTKGIHVVQGWRKSGTGHQFLVETLPGGLYRTLESSELHGLRANARPWSGGEPPEGMSFMALHARLAAFTDTLGVSTLHRVSSEPTTTQEAKVADIIIPKEATQEVLQEVKNLGAEALATALAELAAKNEDGKITPDDVDGVFRSILDDVVDSAGEVVDSLLALPEPYETLSDSGIDAAVSALKQETGVVDDLADLVGDLFRKPEAQEILGKLFKHAARFKVDGIGRSERRERKHAWRLLRAFPEIAAELGISGPSKAEIVLDYKVHLGPDGEIALIPNA